MEKVDNIEKYNKDKIKEVDSHNKNLKEHLQIKAQEETEYITKDALAPFVSSKKIIKINWGNNQYEEIFGHN